MAETTASPANKAVTYQGKPEREHIRAPKKVSVKKAAKRAIKRGLVSEKAAKRHLGSY